MRTSASAAPAIIASCIGDTIAANGEDGGPPPPPPAAPSCGPSAWAAAAPTCPPPAHAPKGPSPGNGYILCKYLQCPSTGPPGSRDAGPPGSRRDLILKIQRGQTEQCPLPSRHPLQTASTSQLLASLSSPIHPRSPVNGEAGRPSPPQPAAPSCGPIAKAAAAQTDLSGPRPRGCAASCAAPALPLPGCRRRRNKYWYWRMRPSKPSSSWN